MTPHSTLSLEGWFERPISRVALFLGQRSCKVVPNLTFVLVVRTEAATCDGHAPLAALEAAALVKNVVDSEEGPWGTVPVRKCTLHSSHTAVTQQSHSSHKLDERGGVQAP